jgi:membrane-associated protease RseP (regulator of RpoE activity)
VTDDSKPEGEPVAPPTPEEPVTAETPADEPTVADAPSEAPTAENAGYAAPAAAAPAAAAAAPAEPVAAAPVAAAPVATAPPPERRGGVFIPTWLAIVIAILLIGGVGFAVGYVSADDGDGDTSNAASSQQVPSTRPPTRNVPGNNTSPNGGNSTSPNGGNTAPNGGGLFPNGRDASQVAFLGVSVENAGNNGGATVTNVRAGSPAADAGLKAGDVITKIGDTTIQSSTDLIRAVRSNKPGDSVTVTYTRDGNSTDVKVELGSLSDATRSAVPS